MMINKKLQSYYTYQRFIKNLLTISGCWYMPVKSGKCRRMCVTVCALLFNILFMVLTAHMSYLNRNNLRNMMRSIGLTTSSIGAILKVGIFWMNRRSLINYHRMLNDVFEEELVRDEKIQTVMLSYLPPMVKLIYTYATVFTLLVMAMFLPAYISIIRDLCHFRLTTNYLLPLTKGKDGYFWTMPDNFLYHFHLIFETVSVALTVIIACSVDGAFGFYIYQFASTMHAMAYRLANPLPTEKLLDLLKICVAKHQKLMQCRNMLEHVYRTIVFWHVSSNAVLLCALIYEMVTFSQVGINVTVLIVALSYALIKLFQSFLYAFYGTVLTNAGEDFRKGIYFSEWPNSGLDRHVRTNVILMMMQKPMGINAFFINVDVDMFTNFVNTTMSYFFLLQSIGDRGE